MSPILLPRIQGMLKASAPSSSSSGGKKSRKKKSVQFHPLSIEYSYPASPDQHGLRATCCLLWARIMRWIRQPLHGLVLKSALVFLALTSTVMLVTRLEKEHYSPRDLTPYASCQIFFLQVEKLTDTLDARHACSVESSARHHPNQTVCLISAAPLAALGPLKAQFGNISNIFVLPLDLDTIFRWTPLNDWWIEDFKFMPSPWKQLHTSQAGRLAFLWKYAGLYVDLDVITLKPFFDLEENFLGIQYYSADDGISPAVLKFARRSHPFLSQWLYAVPTKYEEEDRATIGANLATKLIVPYCQGDPPEGKAHLEELSGKHCDYDLKIFPPEALYPVPWPEWRHLFTATSASDGQSSSLLNRLHSDSTLTLHYWDELSKELSLSQVDLQSPFMSVAEENCPLVYYSDLEPRIKNRKRILSQLRNKHHENNNEQFNII